MGVAASKYSSRKLSSKAVVPVETGCESDFKGNQLGKPCPNHGSRSDKTVDLFSDNKTVTETSNHVSVSWSRIAGSPKQTNAGNRKRTSSTDFLPDRLLPGTLWEGQQLCLQDEMVRSAFIDYVLGSLWQYDLNNRFSDILNRKLPNQEAVEYIVFNDYLVHPKSKTSSVDQNEREAAAAKMQKCTQLKVKDSMTGDSIRRSSNITETLSPETRLLLVLTSLWPLFYSSNAFAVLKAGTESPSTPETPFATAPQHPNITNKAADLECLRRVHDFFLLTLRSLKSTDLNALLCGGCWVNSLLDSVNKIAIPLTISTVNVKQSTYTSVFVNNAFEEMKKTPRSELLGKPCDIFRSVRPDEADVASKIDMCLSRCLGIKIVVQNSRKGGSEFTNLLSLRPVLNWTGDYQHVIAVSSDASRDELSLKDLRLANDYQLILCGIMKG